MNRDRSTLADESVEIGKGRRSRRQRLILALLLALIGWDLGWRRPADQVSTRLILTVIEGYRGRVSPWLERAGVRCRFTPSCSRYAELVLRRDGALEGSLRAAGRLSRCGPWTPAGRVDHP